MEIQPDNVLIRNPFEIFPEEIWEVIIDLLDDPEDIRNVFKACPQFVILGKEFSWLIREIFQLLFPKLLTFQDAKNCRLVSKRWNNAVGNLLEEHPDRLPYKSSRLTRMTETHFNFHHLPIIITDYSKLMRSVNQSRECCNPFPGRHVHVSTEKYLSAKLDLSTGCSTTNSTTEVELKEALPILEPFGSHIWYLTFEVPLLSYWDHPVIFRQVVEPLFLCLSHLPNLRSLKLKQFHIFPYIYDSVGWVNVANVINETNITARLETLDVWDREFEDSTEKNLSQHLIRKLVNHEHMKKLAISSEYWESSYNTLFPNLTELCLRISRETGALENILQQLNSPHLRKLRIWAKDDTLVVDEILEILYRYPIEALELSGKYIEREKSSSECSPRNLLIQQMKLDATPELSYNFFHLIPSLNYLTIELKEWDSYREVVKGPCEFREFLHNFCFKNGSGCRGNNFHNGLIWKRLTNLKMLTVHIKQSNRRVTFTRQFVREFENRVFTTKIQSAPVRGCPAFRRTQTHRLWR